MAKRLPALCAWLGAGVLLAYGVLALVSCVSVTEAPPPRATVTPGQRTLLVLYTAPGPWVAIGQDTNVEAAAKFLPGLGSVVESAQDERNLKLSLDLRQYLPSWTGEGILEPQLIREINSGSYPGTWTSPGSASETDPAVFRKFNRAKDVLEWRLRYFLSEPGETRAIRNYSTFLNLDDALVLEVNLQHGLAGAPENAFIPTLAAKSRLYRAGTMRLLWTAESSVEDKAAARTLWDFMNAPKDLAQTYEKLLPQLAREISSSLLRVISSPSSSVPKAAQDGEAPAPPSARLRPHEGITAVLPPKQAETPQAAELPPSTTEAAVAPSTPTAPSGAANPPPPQ